MDLRNFDMSESTEYLIRRYTHILIIANNESQLEKINRIIKGFSGGNIIESKTIKRAIRYLPKGRICIIQIRAGAQRITSVETKEEEMRHTSYYYDSFHRKKIDLTL